MAQTPFSTFAPKLTGIEALTFAADKGLYFTGPATPAVFDLTAAGRALLDDADAAAQRTTLGLGTMAMQAASGVAITGGSAFGMGGVQIIGSTAPTTGSGLEIQGGALVAMAAYNRDTSAYISLNFDASVVNFRPSGSTRLSVTETGVIASGSMKVPSYTVATLPNAATHGAGAMIYVTDETGGAVVAFSDATNWRRVTDRAVVA